MTTVRVMEGVTKVRGERASDLVRGEGEWQL